MRISLHPRRNRSNAFTLVELLVVIGIIALLVSILLPAMYRAMAQARLIQCRSNLRQIAQWGLMYANDHAGILPSSYNDASGSGPQWPEYADGSAPTTSSWVVLAGTPYNLFKRPSAGKVFTYGTVLHCPEASATFQLRNVGTGTTYALNQFLGGQKTGYVASSVAQPDAPTPRLRLLKADRFWFTESCINFNTTYQAFDSRTVTSLYNTFDQTRIPWTWDTSASTNYRYRGHPGKVSNFVFGDGHVESMSFADFKVRTTKSADRQAFLGQHFKYP